jgi:hypothetical protein
MRDLEQRLRNVEMGLRARPVKVPLGGGGGTLPPVQIWKVVEGKSILPAGVTGIRKLTGIDLTTLTLPAVVDLHAPVGLADGVGVAENIETGARKLVYNGASSIFHDLWLGMQFYAASSIDIPVTGSDPVTTQSYLIPLLVNG